MIRRELDSNKRKQFRLWLSEEERALLETRAEQYGYRYLSEYLRDAGIYNDVMQIDISYTEEVNQLFSDYILDVRKLLKEVRRIMKFDTSASPEEREKIQMGLYRVYSQMKSLNKSVNDNINISAIIKEYRVKRYKNEIKREFNEIINKK